jgi:hypothetical protein
VRGAFKNNAYVLEVESKDLTVEILTKFADDLLAEKLRPTPWRSEEIPEASEDAVQNVVANNHDFVVS